MDHFRVATNGSADRARQLTSQSWQLLYRYPTRLAPFLSFGLDYSQGLKLSSRHNPVKLRIRRYTVILPEHTSLCITVNATISHFIPSGPASPLNMWKETL